MDFKKSKQKIGKKRQKAAKIPSNSSKICIFLKSLKSVAYAIKTFKTSIRFSLKVLRQAFDYSYQSTIPRPHSLSFLIIWIFISS